ncbi:hypothetical protein [Streptomyces diastatochromogenes]|uniref:hypothetical protein n=1 Tax=Streptomyces diastatochromogenes TaxID=42236 RepID=UPI00368C19C0
MHMVGHGLDKAGETWRRLEVTFPDSIATHSTVQTYYFDAATGLVAHYTTEHQDFDGLLVPTRRRVLLRNKEGVADQSFCAILLDISNVKLGR